MASSASLLDDSAASSASTWAWPDWYAEEGLPGALRHAAARGIEVVARLLFQRQRFLDAVLHGEAREQRHGQLHAEAGAGGAADAAAARDAVGTDTGHRIDCRQVAGTGLVGFQAGDREAEIGLAHRRVTRLCETDPVVDSRRRQRRQGHRRGQRLRCDTVAADQLIERDALGAQIVLGRDFGGGGEVEARLRLAGVGDRGGADLEVAFGRCQLLADGFLARLRSGQRVLCHQHVEIGLRHAHDQLLLGGLQVGLRHFERLVGLADGGCVGPVEQRLAAVDGERPGGVAEAVTARIGKARRRIGVRVRGAAGGADAGQTQRLALRGAMLCRVGLGAGSQVGGVVRTRGLVEILQALSAAAIGSDQRKGGQHQLSQTAHEGSFHGEFASRRTARVIRDRGECRRSPQQCDGRPAPGVNCFTCIRSGTAPVRGTLAAAARQYRTTRRASTAARPRGSSTVHASPAPGQRWPPAARRA